MDKQKQSPIARKRGEILAAVRENRVVVINREPATDVLAQVSQYLMEDGHRVVGVPRRPAARSLAKRVAAKVGSDLGDLVGFRTAHGRAGSGATRVMFCADELPLVRELTEHGKPVLVIEIHEWSTEIESLVAWARGQIAERSLKLVLSVMLEAEPLAERFEDCPIVDLAGRRHPVELRQPSATVERDPIEQIVRLSRDEDRTVLVFVPGKGEMGDLVERIERMARGAMSDRLNSRRLSERAEHPDDVARMNALAGTPVWNPWVVTLHGDQTATERKRALTPSPARRPKVVIATDVEESLTIPDIDAVVDLGEERRSEVRYGAKGLYLASTSRATCHQRAACAGRTRPGVYALCSDLPLHDRPAYPKAEIERGGLERMILLLAAAGIDASELEFVHQPGGAAWQAAKAALRGLRALDERGRITKIGRQMSRLPVDVHLARMVVEAQRHGGLDDVVTIAACLEAGGIRDRTGRWRRHTRAKDSDLFAERDVYDAVRDLSDRELHDAGVFPNAYRRAREIRDRLSRAAQDGRERRKGSRAGDRAAVLRACVAGFVNHLYRYEWGAAFRVGEDGGRELARHSVLYRAADAMWIVGQPYDLETKGRRGVVPLIRLATKVDPALLAKVAPHLVAKLTRNARYSAAHEGVVVDKVTVFNGQETTVEPIAAPRAAATREALGWALVRGETGHPAEAQNAETRATLDELHARSGGRVQPLGDQQMHAFYVERIGRATSLAELDGVELALELDAYAPQGLRAEIDRDAPRTIELLGGQVYVTYMSGNDPTVTLPADLVRSGAWRSLPDEAVRLPGGRAVRIGLAAGRYPRYYAELDPGLLKERVREHLNGEQFGAWVDRPDIPTAHDETAEIPPIVEVSYGCDALTGDPLIAYGTPVINPHRFVGSDPLLHGEWFRVRADAVAAHGRAAAELEAAARTAST